MDCPESLDWLAGGWLCGARIGFRSAFTCRPRRDWGERDTVWREWVVPAHEQKKLT
jgi:hypothetical protein